MCRNAQLEQISSAIHSKAVIAGQWLLTDEEMMAVAQHFSKLPH
jgi:hypothetical protein